MFSECFPCVSILSGSGGTKVSKINAYCLYVVCMCLCTVCMCIHHYRYTHMCNVFIILFIDIYIHSVYAISYIYAHNVYSICMCMFNNAIYIMLHTYICIYVCICAIYIILHTYACLYIGMQYDIYIAHIHTHTYIGTHTYRYAI